MTVIRAALAAALAVTLFAAPLAAEAQQPGKLPRIGLLDYSTPDQARLAWWDGFLRRMGELGYVEGRTVAFERRWARGEIKRLSGVTALAADLTTKRLEFLRELLPKGSRMAVLWDPNGGGARIAIRETQATAGRMGLEVRAYAARTPGEFHHAFSAMAKDRAEGLDVATSPMFFTERQRIADLALKQGLPMMVGAREYAEAGALASYGADYVDLFRRVAAYVDRILKGAKPADLPIEQPTTFQLVINLKTARALGLTIPQSLLLRADQVIQ